MDVKSKIENEYIPLSVSFVRSKGFSPYFYLKKALYSLK